MITMEQYEMIRTAHRRYGKTIRELSREYGHHRKTIRKILSGKEPKYRRIQPIKNPVMDTYTFLITSWLLNDEKLSKKQRHTAQRIYDRLVAEHNFQGSYSTVRNFVRKKKNELLLTNQEAMVPLTLLNNGEYEADWGTARIILKGKEQKSSYFCIRSKKSGDFFMKFFPSERQEMFFDAHISAFKFFGGVCKTIIYDNLTTAVKTVLKGRARIEQRQFKLFKSYYNFKAEYCNRGKGNEKGGVEGVVGYTRRNFLVPLLKVDSYEELNNYLLKKCIHNRTRTIGGREEKIPISELYNREKHLLLPLPDKPYENIKIQPAKVDKYQTVKIDKNRYSVPTSFVGYKTQTHISCWKITIYAYNKKIAEHPRLLGNSKWQLNPFHYLELIGRKIRSFDNAKPLEEWRQNWPKSYEKMLEKLIAKKGENKGKREFLNILQLHEIYQPTLVENAIETALELQTYNSEAIKHLILIKNEKQTTIQPVPQNMLSKNLNTEKLSETDIAHFAFLLTKPTNTSKGANS